MARAVAKPAMPLPGLLRELRKRHCVSTCISRWQNPQPQRPNPRNKVLRSANGPGRQEARGLASHVARIHKKAGPPTDIRHASKTARNPRRGLCGQRKSALKGLPSRYWAQQAVSPLHRAVRRHMREKQACFSTHPSADTTCATWPLRSGTPSHATIS